MQRMNRPIIVSFSGIDGAGKSTQIEQLTSFLQKAGLTYSVYTFWDDVVALASLREKMSHKVFRGEKGVGTPSRPIRRRDKNVTTWYATLLRFALYTLDAMKLRLFFRGLDPRNNIIIFDRYLYDELANLPLTNRIATTYTRWILRCIPSPQVRLLLDAVPECATSRKPEYPLEFVKQNRAAYIGMSRIAGMSVIPAGAVGSTAEIIRELVFPQGLAPQPVLARENR